jgi:hypothetical protein
VSKASEDFPEPETPASDDDEPVARQIERDVLEVVLAGAAGRR